MNQNTKINLNLVVSVLSLLTVLTILGLLVTTYLIIDKYVNRFNRAIKHGKQSVEDLIDVVSNELHNLASESTQVIQKTVMSMENAIQNIIDSVSDVNVKKILRKEMMNILNVGRFGNDDDSSTRRHLHVLTSSIDRLKHARLQ